ncbi:hypothetical protein K523DRAFT_10830 [Schizophyllum commune Tattone D]|nr:hypothetical protein K523DRAFT_10830 [Schizophyllum commune Tattone D]
MQLGCGRPRGASAALPSKQQSNVFGVAHPPAMDTRPPIEVCDNTRRSRARTMTGLAVVGSAAYPAVKATAAAAAHLPLSRRTAGRTPFKPSRRTRPPSETNSRTRPPRGGHIRRYPGSQLGGMSEDGGRKGPDESSEIVVSVTKGKRIHLDLCPFAERPRRRPATRVGHTPTDRGV